MFSKASFLIFLLMFSQHWTMALAAQEPGAECTSDADCTGGGICGFMGPTGRCFGGSPTDAGARVDAPAEPPTPDTGNHYGHPIVPTGGDSFRSPADGGRDAAPSDVNIHAAAPSGDSTELTSASPEWKNLKTFGIVGLALLGFNAILLIVLIIMIWRSTRKASRYAGAAIEPHYLKRRKLSGSYQAAATADHDLDVEAPPRHD